MAHENATPRPWEVTRPYRTFIGQPVCNVSRGTSHPITINGRLEGSTAPIEFRAEDNAALIVEAVNGYEALTAERDRLANENAMLRRAMTVSAMHLGTGFIECGRCGEEVETKHTDAEYTLRGALSQDRPA